MTQCIAILRTAKDEDILQVFGPYATEAAALAAVDWLMDWPAMKIGWWEVVPLYPDPPQHPYPAYTPNAGPYQTYTYQLSPAATFTIPVTTTYQIGS